MKKPITPNSTIRHALRCVWLRSRERTEALRNTDYCCSVCGVRQTAAKGREVKLDVHHVGHVTNWGRIFDVIREELLCDPKLLAPLCRKCHEDIHEKEEA